MNSYLIFHSVFVLITLGIRDAGCNPYFSPYNLPYRTLSPIDIISDNTTPLPGLPPLVLSFSSSTTAYLLNTGSSIQLVTSNSSSTTISGGILGSAKYELVSFRFIWNGNNVGRSAGTIDGVGYPITVETTFKNTMCGNFADALKFRLGLVIAYSSISVEGHLPNPLFTAFQVLTNAIIRANTTSPNIAPGGFIGSLIPAASNFGFYYSYLGSYYQESDGKRYDSAIVIRLANSVVPIISIDQFNDVFLKVLSPAGDPYANIFPTFDPGSRTVYQCSGVLTGSS